VTSSAALDLSSGRSMRVAKAFWRISTWWLLGAVGALGACSDESPDSLQAWLQQERALHAASARSDGATATTSPSKVPELPAQAKIRSAVSDPFSSLRLRQTASELTRSTPPRADPGALPNQPLPLPLSLDAAPLHAMSLVGTVLGQGQPMALLKLNGLVYPVRLGDRLGPEQGRVISITRTGLVLREPGRSVAGQPTEREISLSLA
jgi:type IV pilus assembly protein PilP